MIKIQNVYYMLAYAFDILNRDAYKKMGHEKFDNALDLYAAILNIGISQLIKQGLGREYVEITEQGSMPRGKFNISETIKKQTLIHKEIIYQTDEFQENALLNQIIKTTCHYLIQSKAIQNQHKQALKSLMVYFRDVDILDIHLIDWYRITYYRNNLMYKMLINICYLTIEGFLQNEKKETQSNISFIDDQKLHRLFEKFVLNFYKKHHPSLKPKAKEIKWNTDDNVVDFLPIMKTDVVLTGPKKILIIDTKFYKKMMQRNYSETQHSNNMYQIFSYVKNAITSSEIEISGLLLYARTEEGQLPDQTYTIDGHHITVKSIDLNTDFKNISNTLETIIQNNFKC